MPKKVKEEIFVGSIFWLFVFIVVFWPFAIYYYFSKKRMVEYRKDD